MRLPQLTRSEHWSPYSQNAAEPVVLVRTFGALIRGVARKSPPRHNLRPCRSRKAKIKSKNAIVICAYDACSLNTSQRFKRRADSSSPRSMTVPERIPPETIRITPCRHVLWCTFQEQLPNNPSGINFEHLRSECGQQKCVPGHNGERYRLRKSPEIIHDKFGSPLILESASKIAFAN